MQVRSKLFPYPVLNHNIINSSYFNKIFELSFERVDSKNGILLRNIKFKTDSNYILVLFRNGLIGVKCVIECSYTVFRRTYELSTEDGNNILLDKNDFDGKVEISSFAYAKEDFILFSDEFSDEYKGMEFEIDKYDLIAINDGFIAKFEHLETEENVAKSIFNITFDNNIEEDGMYEVKYEGGKKINIYLSRNEYQNYKVVYNSDGFKEVFFSMLLVPVLTEAFTTIKKLTELDTFSDIEDICTQYGWFYSIKYRYNQLKSHELTKDDILEWSPIQIAQEILGKPFAISLCNILDVVKNNKEGDSDNE